MTYHPDQDWNSSYILSYLSTSITDLLMFTAALKHMNCYLPIYIALQL